MRGDGARPAERGGSAESFEAVAADLGVASREVREMESRLYGQDLGFDGASDAIDRTAGAACTHEGQWKPTGACTMQSGQMGRSHLVQLTPGDWHAQINELEPDFLLVESAWQGHKGEWEKQVPQVSATLRKVIAYCRRKGIRTAFWNKEDPVHFSLFLGVAALVDTVFTTDIDRIRAYRQKLGHARVQVVLDHPVCRLGQPRAAAQLAAARGLDAAGRVMAGIGPGIGHGGLQGGNEGDRASAGR